MIDKKWLEDVKTLRRLGEEIESAIRQVPGSEDREILRQQNEEAREQLERAVRLGFPNLLKNGGQRLTEIYKLTMQLKGDSSDE